MNDKIISFIQGLYQTNQPIPLHAPIFNGNEQKYVAETIESTFVSSVGRYVSQFEDKISQYTQANCAVATNSGSAALHTALYLAGVTTNDLVITQALTFVATCNCIAQLGAQPLFIDVSKTSLSLCPEALETYLTDNAFIDGKGQCIHSKTKQKIKAIVPMHSFGHPALLDELTQVCTQWNLTLIEDAAESLGSFYKGKHTGTLGDFAALSFNGNKVITTGGGGMLLTKSSETGHRGKHITTTAKTPHPYEFFHDELGFNYRMPNLNAALGCAQLEQLPTILASKRRIAEQYQNFFSDSDFQFVAEPDYAHSNYWLNAIICPNKKVRDSLLQQTNGANIMTRPVWQLMHKLPMYKSALRDNLKNSLWLEQCLVNLPSSVK
ncbi:LegC family aminotransferase [Psychrobium sp. 1_MG-2023]|uniref:LegC family aminotransferase n=1 Tax=Psychrobium sp. 1_MG-2023 TaxID=3062624 RepID=UPI000C336DEC|nr:LegC family aminotransferase [Psychrobium sp. 1_MG-2023]MDP2559846.1 LegC family aminotransferase [Psychrobium sp. 1_MG-2023]PKF59050.1 aminotransferase DegT [Alteromonadales bacterium alter-6D02]